MKRKFLLSITATLALATVLSGARKVSTLTSTLIEFGFTPVKLKRAQNHLFASCRLNGESVDLAIDTGSQRTVVSAAKLASAVGPIKNAKATQQGYWERCPRS